MNAPGADEIALMRQHPKLFPPEAYERAWQPTVSDGSGFDRNKTREALALLKEAGFELRDSRMVSVATGEQLSFVVTVQTRNQEKMLSRYFEQLRRLGIRAEMKFVDGATYEHAAPHRRFRHHLPVHHPAAVAGPGAAPRLGEPRRDARDAGGTQHHRARRSGHRRADRARDRREDASRADARGARARPRAAMGPLRHSGLFRQPPPRRALEPPDAAGEAAEVRLGDGLLVVPRRGPATR